MNEREAFDGAVRSLLYDWNPAAPDKPRFQVNGDSLTFRELCERAKKLDIELLSHPEILGLRPNGRLDLELRKREIDFLEIMSKAATASEKQWKWLDDINARRKGAAA